MIAYFIKKPKFTLSVTFILLLLLASFGYEHFYHGYIWPNESRIDENGTLIGPPFTPTQSPPFGTDRLSTPIFAKIIQGAKFTIISALIISSLQVSLAFLISIVFAQLPRFVQKTIEGIVESSLYVPASIVAFLILIPLQQYYNPNEDFSNFYKLYGIQITIITLIGIPQLVLLFTKDIQKTMKEEYILASITLGSRGFRLFRTHIVPYMIPRLVLQFTQRTVEVLILLAHLGFLAVFLGGFVMKEVYYDEFKEFSLSNEWAGLIGSSFRDLMLTPWMIFFPLMFFAITVLSFNMISTSIQEYIQSANVRRKKRYKLEKIEENMSHKHKEAFALLHKQSSNF